MNEISTKQMVELLEVNGFHVEGTAGEQVLVWENVEFVFDQEDIQQLKQILSNIIEEEQNPIETLEGAVRLFCDAQKYAYGERAPEFFAAMVNKSRVKDGDIMRTTMYEDVVEVLYEGLHKATKAGLEELGIEAEEAFKLAEEELLSNVTIAPWTMSFLEKTLEGGAAGEGGKLDPVKRNWLRNRLNREHRDHMLCIVEGAPMFFGASAILQKSFLQDFAEAIGTDTLFVYPYAVETAYIAPFPEEDLSGKKYLYDWVYDNRIDEQDDRFVTKNFYILRRKDDWKPEIGKLYDYTPYVDPRG